MLQCCSVCSIECCVFSVYISYIPQYLHIYRFTHCWLADSVLPGQTVGRMQPRKQTITRLQTPAPALCHSYFGQISQNPSRLKMLHTAPHTSHSGPDRIIMSHTTQNLQLMPQFPSASLALALMAAFFRGDFSHALKNRHFKTSTPLL